ncbi:MAG: GlsB/YeaQ/YmgE family stress response membrane protein, partial [Nitrospira sp.]|nr:GlsB/YeaQ/YmgE family stress response membrane protein [Nitrospira sp.]
PGKDPGGFFATIAIGIIGALFGGVIGRLLGMYQQDDPVGFVMAVIGAIVFLWLYRMITRRGNS